MTFTRRGVLGAGALAGAWIGLPKALRTWRQSSGGAPQVLVLWSGDATQTTVELTALTQGGTSVGPAIATNSDMAGAVFLPAAPPDQHSWNRWHASGLRAGTQYFWQLVDTSTVGRPLFFGPIARFKTLQPIGKPCTIKRAFGTCTQNDTPSQHVDPAAFVDIIEWGPDRVGHHGDLGYPAGLTRHPGTHVKALTKNLQVRGMSGTDHAAGILQLFCMDYIRSDHDTNSGNNLPNYHDPVTAASIVAWQEMVPFRQADSEYPTHGLWRSEVEGRVRFIKLDYRSIDRSNSIGEHPASLSSTMLGATQLTWLKDELLAAAVARQLVVLLTDSSWNGVCPNPVPMSLSDKMPAYQHERDHISDFAAAIGVDMIIVHGDTHLMLQDETHEKNGFVVIGCSPFDQLAQGHFQDSYDWVYPPGQPATRGTVKAQQYQRLVWADDGTTITFTATARDCSKGAAARSMRTLTRTYRPGS
ncbi:MAG: hypothetical protein QOI06_2034 [Nocardioidaceae bacterium]|nr:hypothetical protein [Nocardioidaceae bacterium]